MDIQARGDVAAAKKEGKQMDRFTIFIMVDSDLLQKAKEKYKRGAWRFATDSAFIKHLLEQIANKETKKGSNNK